MDRAINSSEDKSGELAPVRNIHPNITGSCYKLDCLNSNPCDCCKRWLYLNTNYSFEQVLPEVRRRVLKSLIEDSINHRDDYLDID